jgi:hypothetical protein
MATALRKCVVLGGKSGSAELRDWATRELKGYGPDDDLPDYRVIAAPLLLDGISGHNHITRQPLAPFSLPEFAREHIKEEVRFYDGVGAIEALLQQDEIKLSPPRATDLAMYMNSQSDNPYQRILAIYWGVAHAAVRGMLDQIRTALTQLAAELRASMPRDQDVPSPETANQALNVVITGRRARVKMTTAQASGETATATSASTNATSPDESGWWTRSRKIGAFVVGVATVVAAVAAVIAL